MAEVLVVEDDDDVAFLVQAFLELSGHHVERAPDGEKGLRCLASRFPDIVVMDVEMPLLSGPGMAARMIAEDCGRECIPIVIVSGANALRSIADVVGTPYFLPKPFDAGDLLSLVSRALRERLPPHPHLPA